MISINRTLTWNKIITNCISRRGIRLENKTGRIVHDIRTQKRKKKLKNPRKESNELKWFG